VCSEVTPSTWRTSSSTSPCAPQPKHLGSAHDEAELVALRAAAVERIAAGQALLDLGVGAAAGAGRLEIVGSKAGQLWDALCRAYDTLA